jgi:DNA-binding MarR family transcriptional regulator
MRRRRKLPSDQELIGRIAEIADDGYCPVAELSAPFRDLESRTLTRALKRAANRGLILDRRGPDGRRYVAVAAEGRRLLGSA